MKRPCRRPSTPRTVGNHFRTDKPPRSRALRKHYWRQSTNKSGRDQFACTNCLRFRHRRLGRLQKTPRKRIRVHFRSLRCSRNGCHKVKSFPGSGRAFGIHTLTSPTGPAEIHILRFRLRKSSCLHDNCTKAHRCKMPLNNRRCQVHTKVPKSTKLLST